MAAPFCPPPSFQETTGQITKPFRASVSPTSLQKPMFYCWDLKEMVLGELQETLETLSDGSGGSPTGSQARLIQKAQMPQAVRDSEWLLPVTGGRHQRLCTPSSSHLLLEGPRLLLVGGYYLCSLAAMTKDLRKPCLSPQQSWQWKILSPFGPSPTKGIWSRWEAPAPETDSVPPQAPPSPATS